MLFIYGNLVLGGVETFYIRMAKARFEKGLRTKILLTSAKKASDQNLLVEMGKYADIFFIEDFFKFEFEKHFPFHFLLLLPLNLESIKKIFEDVNQVHVSNSIYAIFYFKIQDKLNLSMPVTIGVYHSKEYIWESKRLPLFERKNRNIFSIALKSNAAVFFNEKLPEIYKNFYDFRMGDINIFPLGVIDKRTNFGKINLENKKIKIISIGRLVSFKTYNFWMIDVVNELMNFYDVEYHIYGAGPEYKNILEKISKLNLQNNIILKGELPYSLFRDTVVLYDLFVGSGTAIIESSSLGVPSIVGIESVNFPLSYGFVCDIPGFSYNEDGLYEKRSVFKLIDEFLRMNDDERQLISQEHVRWANKFTMDSCVEEFEKLASRSKLISINKSAYAENFKYCISFFGHAVISKIFKKSDNKYL